MHLEAVQEDKAALERRESSMRDVIFSLREKQSKLGQQPRAMDGGTAHLRYVPGHNGTKKRSQTSYAEIGEDGERATKRSRADGFISLSASKTKPDASTKIKEEPEMAIPLKLPNLYAPEGYYHVREVRKLQ